jgi:tight adherence protein B
MFGVDTTIIAIAGLAALAVGGIAFAFWFNTIDQERQTDRRLKNVKTAETDRSVVNANRERTADANKRRKNVQEALKQLEEKQKARNANKPPLNLLIRQAGLTISVQQFYLGSIALGVTLAIAVYVFSGGMWLASLGVLVAGALGLPRWIVGFIRKRRVKAFLNEFPNSIDVIVRAVKSGLPLNDGIRLIASEAQEPVKAEFRRIVEQQQLGLSIPEAVSRMGESMPCSEANFFGIVIQIQSQAGGNLSEALGNLSRVLRDRKKMKAKINALSMEAKASAAIIGALPFIVAFLVYLTSPDYIMPLFTHSTGHLILGVAAIWMSIGLFIMKNMINFDF